MEIIHNIDNNKKEENYQELSNVEAEIALIGCLLRENRFFDSFWLPCFYASFAWEQ